MDNTALEQLNDLLSKNDKVGIVVAKDPSLDQMAAALSLYLSLREIGKNVSVASPTEPIVAISSLVGINKVRNSLDGEGGDLVVSFPYQEGEIEKVSYTLENSQLNIIVKAGEQGLSFNEQDVQYKRTGGTPSLLFVVGAAQLSQLGSLFNPEALKDTVIVNIDNQTDNQGYGDVVLVSPELSSVSEQVAQILLSLDLPVDQDISQNLLSGIAQATNNFQDPKTSFVAFETAGVLMRRGAQRPRLTGQSQQQPNQGFVRQNNQQGQRRMPQFPRSQGQGQRQAQPQQTSQGGQRFGGQQRQQAQPQPRSQETQQPQQDDSGSEQPPSDWLEPKVYKGSTPL